MWDQTKEEEKECGEGYRDERRVDEQGWIIYRKILDFKSTTFPMHWSTGTKTSIAKSSQLV
jgi:hypothetical protein